MQRESRSPDQRPGTRWKDPRLVSSAMLPLAIVVLMWSVHIIDLTFGLGLSRFGIYPRELHGLWGIAAAPFLHGSFEHLFNNSIPMLVLGSVLLYVYPRAAGPVVLAVWLLGGMWVWISARSNFHIGASGVVYGLAAFLFFSGVIRRQRTLMGVSMLVVFLYGGMVWGLFPLVERISWESHLWGALAGVAMAVVYRKVEPAIQDPKPVYFDDEEEEDDNELPDTLPTAQRRSSSNMTIIYHLDPGDEADEEQLRWKRELGERARPDGKGLPDDTDTTW